MLFNSPVDYILEVDEARGYWCCLLFGNVAKKRAT
jgi:hypothetical protein